MFPIYSCRCVVRTTVSRQGTITLIGSHLKAGEAQSWFVFLTFRIKNFGTRILHSGCANALTRWTSLLPSSSHLVVKGELRKVHIVRKVNFWVSFFTRQILMFWLWDYRKGRPPCFSVSNWGVGSETQKFLYKVDVSTSKIKWQKSLSPNPTTINTAALVADVVSLTLVVLCLLLCVSVVVLCLCIVVLCLVIIVRLFLIAWHLFMVVLHLTVMFFSLCNYFASLCSLQFLLVMLHHSL